MKTMINLIMIFLTLSRVASIDSREDFVVFHSHVLRRLQYFTGVAFDCLQQTKNFSQIYYTFL